MHTASQSRTTCWHKGIGIGKHKASDNSTVGGYQWSTFFYPDGKHPEDTDSVSVFIALASDDIDVKALFELSLLDQSGKGKHYVHSHFDRPLESRPYTLQKRGSMWGYKRFTMLEQSDYLKDDCLKFRCIVGLLGDDLVGKRDEKDKEETLSHQNQLAEMIRSYL